MLEAEPELPPEPAHINEVEEGCCWYVTKHREPDVIKRNNRYRTRCSRAGKRWQVNHLVLVLCNEHATQMMKRKFVEVKCLE